MTCQTRFNGMLITNSYKKMRINNESRNMDILTNTIV